MASVQGAVLQSDAIEPIIMPPRSLGRRFALFIQVWSFKIFVNSTLAILRVFKIGGIGVFRPTYTKTYPVGARLQNSVWLPESYKSGQTLPLLIDIHGGGFVIGDTGQGLSLARLLATLGTNMTPRDVEWCRYLANEHGFCVVSLDYRKAPSYPFPYQTEDLVEIVQEVLKDNDMPVDKTKIAICGFSAGAKHALSISQKDELQHKIKALLLWYPVVDFSGKYKGTFRPASDGSPDMLLKTSEMFNYAYVPEGQDRRDPLLSPIYADRSKLPEKIFFIGAEYDVLCHEAEIAADLYANAEHANEKIGDDNEWRAGGIFWKRVLDAQHGFNFVRKRWNAAAEAKRLDITAKMYEAAAVWLKREVYS
ncbi:putative alpha beta hydrolase fold protein [Phaeomoniella chlamydospora]|uniref:Putative alpha beta hydrolase fold protein n=1 Tax=Phaeomoniella chlamydospora TaxID=158046 RepID=A0A0G2DSK2_PHACM|nr:putative alpha beta hydrolase fold protein [Phaeomoniella chlamydospora]